MSRMVSMILINTMKMSETCTTNRIVHLLRVVHHYGMRSHFIMISRTFIGASFNLEVLIVFENLCYFNNVGKNSIP
jgi:hypothetical protein